MHSLLICPVEETSMEKAMLSPHTWYWMQQKPSCLLIQAVTLKKNIRKITMYNLAAFVLFRTNSILSNVKIYHQHKANKNNSIFLRNLFHCKTTLHLINIYYILSIFFCMIANYVCKSLISHPVISLFDLIQFKNSSLHFTL